MFLPSYDAIPTNNSTSHINSNSNLIANHYNQNDNETEIRQYSFSIKTLAVFGLVFSLSLCVTTLSTYYAVKRNPFPQKITCTPQLSSAFSSRTSSLALTECLNDCDKPCSTYQSENGPLYCSWYYDSPHHMMCLQTIKENGQCYCGTAVDNRNPSSYYDFFNKLNANIHDDDWTPFRRYGPGNYDDDFTSPLRYWKPCLHECSYPCGHIVYNDQDFCCEENDLNMCQIKIDKGGRCYCSIPFVTPVNDDTTSMPPP